MTMPEDRSVFPHDVVRPVLKYTMNYHQLTGGSGEDEEEEEEEEEDIM